MNALLSKKMEKVSGMNFCQCGYNAFGVVYQQGYQWSASIVLDRKLTLAIADKHKSALILIFALSLCLRGDNSVKLAESDNSDSELVTREDDLCNGVLHDI